MRAGWNASPPGSLLTPQSSTEQQPLAVPDEVQPSKRERLVSLDAFRGATMALMVLVNDPGDGGSSYGPLKHSAWNGWTITDAGISSSVDCGSRNHAFDGKSPPLRASQNRSCLHKIARRAVILYALGLLIYVYPAFNLSTERVLGVLQRIAICYLIASAIYLTTSWRGQLVWIAGLLSAYWLMMKLIPVPHYGAGHLDVDRNFAHYVDAMVLGRHNYAGKTWDPEGIVSTLPAIATTLFGIMAGHLLRLKRTLSERVTWLFFAGNVLIAAGLILTFGCLSTRSSGQVPFQCSWRVLISFCSPFSCG